MEHTNHTPTTDPVLTSATEIKAKLDQLSTLETAEIAKVKAKFDEKRTKLQSQLKAALAVLAERRKQEDELFRGTGVAMRERTVLGDDVKAEDDAIVLNAIHAGGPKRAEIQAACASLGETRISMALKRLRESGKVATAGQKVAMRYFPADAVSQPSA